MASFLTPVVHVNQVGWGPTELPDRFVLLPFNPFSKSDRLGRAADFAQKDSWLSRNRWRDDQVGDSSEAFTQVEDPSKRRIASRGGFRGRWQRGRGNRGGSVAQRRDPEAERTQVLKGKQAKYLVQHTRGKQVRGRGRGMPHKRWNNRRDQITLEASVKIQSEWRLVEEISLSALTKFKSPVPKAVDLKWCGSLCRYNDIYERISTRNIAKLSRFPSVVFNSASSIDDQVLQEYAKENSGKGRVVLATDELLAHLMASPRSIYPWDLVFTRFDTGIMFLDKRDESGVEMLTVNETSTTRLNEDGNEKSTVSACDTPHKLAIEATAINQNFSQQIVDKSKKKSFPNPNHLFDPEDEEPGAEPANFAYRYREWNLDDDLKIIARTELHSFSRVPLPGGKKKVSYMTAFALNETDPRLTASPSWRQKIDSSRGSVLADGLKNNSCKMGKWTVQTLLSGADQMKIGFVTRRSVKDAVNHEVIGTQFYKPDDFAQQINLQQSNCWGIIKNLVETIYNEPAGKYLVLRDPNKPQLQIYQVPLNSFVEEEASDEENEYEGTEQSDVAPKKL